MTTRKIVHWYNNASDKVLPVSLLLLASVLLITAGVIIYIDDQANQSAFDEFGPVGKYMDYEMWTNINSSEDEMLIKQFTISKFDQGFVVESASIENSVSKTHDCDIYFIKILFNTKNPNFSNWLNGIIEKHRKIFSVLEMDEEGNYHVNINDEYLSKNATNNTFPLVKDGEGTYIVVFDDDRFKISAYTVIGYMSIHVAPPYPHFSYIYTSQLATLWEGFFDPEADLMVIGDESFKKVN